MVTICFSKNSQEAGRGNNARELMVGSPELGKGGFSLANLTRRLKWPTIETLLLTDQRKNRNSFVAYLPLKNSQARLTHERA